MIVSTCTAVQWWRPLCWGGRSQAFHIHLLLPVPTCRRAAVTSRWLPPIESKEASAKEEGVLLCPELPCQGVFWLILCPVLLSVKWGNNAYLIRMFQELDKSFGKYFTDGQCWYSARGSNFSCFFGSLRPNPLSDSSLECKNKWKSIIILMAWKVGFITFFFFFFHKQLSQGC